MNVVLRLGAAHNNHNAGSSGAISKEQDNNQFHDVREAIPSKAGTGYSKSHPKTEIVLPQSPRTKTETVHPQSPHTKTETVYPQPVHNKTETVYPQLPNSKTETLYPHPNSKAEIVNFHSKAETTYSHAYAEGTRSATYPSKPHSTYYQDVGEEGKSRTTVYTQHNSYPGCFGLPYQDHNYGAPPPPSPPPPASPQRTIIPLVVPQGPLTPERFNGHVEVEDVGGGPMVPDFVEQLSENVTTTVDDSVTRCICDFIHDDGYMICCDKCSVWQHIDCMDIDRNNIPDSYFCEICDPRPLDTERARQIQLKKKEFLDTLTADSSATDTDPEMETNGQMSRFDLGGQQEGGSKTKAKKRTKSGSLIIKGDGKKRKIKKEKKDIKKEKENKEHYKLPKVIGRETLAGIKSRKSKLQANKKPGLSLMITDNTQNPWDSSCSPWVDKYEEAYENDYSADIKTLLGSTRINGVHPERKTLNGQLQQAPLCHVTEVNKNRKGLEASQTLGEGEAVIEYTGRVMFKHQLDREKFFKQLNPFVLFYNKINNCEICIDATTYGNIARFIRRSCKANAEICHEVIDGQVKFFVYSTKVIPRGSEITLPYDYNYKDCAYCVECACLRSNCPVAKFFKKKLSTPVKKDKTPTKSHKSPVKSPIKLTIKSPVKKTVEEEEVEKEVPKVEETKLEVESEPAPVEEKPALRTSRRESPRIASSEQNTDPQTSQPSLADVVTDMEESSSSTASVVEKNQHKMTREERKMEAIMKAFEKMEKRQERRKEALSRIDQRKSVDCKPEEKEKCEKVKKEEKTEKPKEKEKPVKEKVQKSLKEPVPDKPVVQQPEPVEVKEEKEEIQEEIKVKEKPEVDTPAESVTPKEKPKPKSKKAKRISSRRRTRANSGNAASEPALSVDDGSNSANVPAMPPAASCPNTPTVAPPETPNSSPSFKFLKTKKHLMNEWLNEKNQDVALTSTPSDFHPKTESLQVEVEETVFVTCLPSPRNAMEHLRRNSQSSGSMMHSKGGAVSGENSIGSAKKRWLRQAMWDKPKSEDTTTTPSTPNSALGGNASPNPSLLSPGASPPGDFVTPLKKRRLARESCDMPLPSGTTTPPLVSCTTYKDGASLDESDTSGIESMSTSIEDKVTSPMSSQMELSRARRLSGAGDTVGWSVRDSIDSEVSESAGVSSESVGPSSSRLSADLSSDSEHERTHSKVYTGNSHKEDRTCSMCSLEEICEVTNSVDNHHDQNRGQSLLRSSECDSDISEAQTVTSHNSEVCGQVLALMEVDSTDDVSRTGRFRSNSLDNVSDCTQSTRDGVVSGSRDNLRHSEVETAVSDSTQSDRPHHLEGVVSNSTQDSEPPNVEGVVSNSTQDIRLHVEGVVSNSLDVRLPQVEGVICNSTQGLRLTQREAEVCDSVEGEELRPGEVSDSTVGMRSNVTEELVSDSTGNMRQGRGRGIVSDTSDILRVQRPSLCDSTSISEEMGSHEQPGCSSDTGQSVCVDSSTDMSATERCPETLPNIATSTGQRFSSRESNPSGSHIEQDVISASDVTTHHWDRDNVGSSSDGRSIFKVFSGVSSSSEFRKQVPVAIVESSQGVDHGSSVTSSGHASISCEIGNEMVDSSESEALANRADSEEITVEAEIVNISDSVYGSIDHDIREVEGGSLCGAGYTARDSVTEGVMFPSDNRPQDALCTSSLVNEEPGHTSSSSVTEDSNPVCRPNMSHEFEVIGSEEQKEGGEREESSLYTSSQQVEVDPMPLPTKKKVSLLEYRKRLKVKGSTSSTSSSSSSSSSTSSSYPSSSQILTSSHRLSLPSLPLFDASTSPTKESNSSRHQFKSSSDLIRRTSLEKKREKPLSLTERLRKEFGFEDCEEENKAEAKQVLGAQLKSPLPSSSFSSHSTPPPPPPPRPAATSNWNSYDTREADSQSATQQGAILNQSTVPSLPPAEILSNRGVPSRNIPAPSMVPPPTGSLSAPASLAGNHLLNVSRLGQPSPVNGVPPAGSNLLNGPLPRQVSSAAPGLLPPVVAPHLLNGPHPANLLPASLPGPHLNGPHTGLQSQGNGTVLNQHHPPSGIPSQNITRAPHQPPIYQKQQSHPPGNVDHQPHRYPLPPSNVNGGQGVFHSSHNNSGTNFMSSQNNRYPSQTNGEYHHSYNDDSYQGAGSKGSSYRGVSKGMHESPSYRGSKGSRDSSPFYGHGRGSRDSSPHNQSSRDSPSYRGGSKSARDSSPYGYSPSHHKYHSQRRKSKYKSSSSHSSHRYSDSSSRYH